MCDSLFKHGKVALESHSLNLVFQRLTLLYIYSLCLYMFLCIAAGLTLYFTAEAIVKAISWQKKFIRKTNEQQLPSPSLSRAIYCIWQTGPKDQNHPSFLCLPMGYPCGILQNVPKFVRYRPARLFISA